MIKEEFKDLPEEEFVSLDEAIHPAFSGRYKINKLGWIKTVSTGEIKKDFNITNLYPRVSFRSSKDRIKKGYPIHILLSKIFLINDDPINKTQVDHINRVKTDYSLENLRWVTPAENLKNRENQSKSRSKAFRKYDDKGNFIEEIKYLDLTTREIETISASIRIGCKSGGFIWKRVDLDLENYISKYGDPKDDEWKESNRCPGLFCNKNGILKVNGNLTVGSLFLSGGYRIITYHGVRYRLHRLIYETFNDILLEDGVVIDHISCVPDDNRLENLRAGTQQDNMKNPNTILKISKPVVKFSLKGEKLDEYISATEASRENDIKSKSDIINVCTGKSCSSGGYLWCFKGDESLIPEKVNKFSKRYLGNVKWTKEAVRLEALKYKTRIEFRNKSNKAYRASLRNNWIDEFFPKIKGDDQKTI